MEPDGGAKEVERSSGSGEREEGCGGGALGRESGNEKGEEGRDAAVQ